MVNMEDWIETELGKLFHTTSGGTPKRSNKEFYYGNIPWVKSGELSKGLILKTEENITQKAVEKSSAKIFPKGTLLIALYGATIGKLGILGVDAATNQAICGIFENGLIPTKFVFYFLASKKAELTKSGIGGAQPNISQATIKNLKFPLFSLPIQRAVVQKLETLLTNLDNGIAQLKKAEAQLKIYRQAVLKKAFEGELTKEWREQQTDLPTAETLLEQIKTERQKHYDQQIEKWKTAVKDWEANGKEGRKPGKPKKLKEFEEIEVEELKELGNLPEESFFIYLRYITKNITDGDHQPPPKSESGIPFITISNIKNNTINFTSTNYVNQEYFENLKKYRKPFLGDILYTVTGSFGIPVLINFQKDFCFQRHIGLIRPLSIINQKWLYYLLTSNLIFKQASNKATGTAQKTVGLESIRQFIIPLTSFQEQTQIVQEIESRLSVCDNLSESIKVSLQKAKALRQSILKKAFEGRLLSEEELAACRAAADYEPAAVLLERIKAEKAKREAEEKAKKKRKTKNKNK